MSRVSGDRLTQAFSRVKKAFQLGKLLWCDTNSGIHNPLCHVDQDIGCGNKWTLSPSKLLGQAFVFYTIDMLAAVSSRNWSSSPTKKVFDPRSVGISETIFFKCEHIGGRLSETECYPSVREAEVRVRGL